MTNFKYFNVVRDGYEIQSNFINGRLAGPSLLKTTVFKNHLCGRYTWISTRICSVNYHLLSAGYIGINFKSLECSQGHDHLWLFLKEVSDNFIFL